MVDQIGLFFKLSLADAVTYSPRIQLPDVNPLRFLAPGWRFELGQFNSNFHSPSQNHLSLYLSKAERGRPKADRAKRLKFFFFVMLTVL